ncbi:MAG: hypothetical protein LRS43_00070 [Desulfurococcales archaeon]|nr:hypothetical protein [Desulfurococcales archaeon]
MNEEMGVTCSNEDLNMTARIILMLKDDLRIKILMLLLVNDTLSFRSIAKKLRVGYKRLDRYLNSMARNGLVEIMKVKISEERIYTVYSLEVNFREYLAKIIENIQCVSPLMDANNIIHEY